MSRIDPIVRKETANVALWVAVGILPVQAVFLIGGWWQLSVLLGSLLGSAVAIGNFFAMCLTVQKALDRDKKKAAQTIQLSQSGRLLAIGAVLVVAGLLKDGDGNHLFNIWATLIPLLIPQLAVRVRNWKLAKDNPSPDRPAIGYDDEDEEDEE